MLRTTGALQTLLELISSWHEVGPKSRFGVAKVAFSSATIDAQGSSGGLKPREAAVAQQLSRDPEVTNRLIQQGLYFLGIGEGKEAFDRKLVERKN